MWVEGWGSVHVCMFEQQAAAIHLKSSWLSDRAAVRKVGRDFFFFLNHFVRKLSKDLSALLSLPDLFIKIEECPWKQLQISRLIHPSALIWTDTCLPQTYGLWSFTSFEKEPELDNTNAPKALTDIWLPTVGGNWRYFNTNGTKSTWAPQFKHVSASFSLDNSVCGQ